MTGIQVKGEFTGIPQQKKIRTEVYLFGNLLPHPDPQPRQGLGCVGEIHAAGAHTDRGLGAVVAKGEGGAVSDLLDPPGDSDNPFRSRDPPRAPHASRDLGDDRSPGDDVVVGFRGEATAPPLDRPGVPP